MKNIIKKLAYLIFGIGYTIFTVYTLFLNYVLLKLLMFNLDRFTVEYDLSEILIHLALFSLWIVVTRISYIKYKKTKSHEKSDYIYCIIPFITLALVSLISFF